MRRPGYRLRLKSSGVNRPGRLPTERKTKLKIAFTTTGDSQDSPLDPRFGRAAGFLVYDSEKDAFEAFSNTQNVNAVQGTGIQAAQNLGSLGVDALVTGHCGPKAFMVLSRAGIKVYNTDLATVSQALKAFLNGELTAAESADSESHWV